MSSTFSRLHWIAAGLALTLLGGAVPLAAQSLADVAKKEEERRKDVKDPAKVYTNKDLTSVPGPSSPSPAGAGDTAPADKETPAKDASKDATAKDAAAKDATAKDAAPKDAEKDKGGKKDQAYWADRLKQLQSALDRDQIFADSLQTRINALTTDFVNRDDPAQRASIERDRQKALQELTRVKKQIVDDKKAIDDLQEEARRAGVPPGWLRS